MQPELRIPAQAGELSVSQNRVLRNTYMLLSLTMIPTLIGAMIGMQLDFGIMRTNPIMSFVVILAVFYGMVFAIEKNKDSGLGVALLLGFTFMLGLLLAPLLQSALGLSNGGQIIAMAAAGTGVSFFSMAAIATVTKRDFSFMGKFLMVGVIVAMIAIVANVFLQMPVLSLTISAVVVLLSTMLILYTLSGIIHGGETNYVSATLSLYISIYNIFSGLVQLLMAFTGNRD
ncbi:MAG: Bax inhibitor-1/YccA family protein [Rhodocyclaceae bacterium]|jgi:modulator of FtsH protease|nr:Bax inhibitor-1/YccA family protein [Rhodocyclaceae bacterium]MCE2980716.1 Bax inhibitor-1/YccA family protein [Betaproteobacteria bacterium]MCA3073969.1 Bax inhibitor-1/YccA family protein [Rhodocyclaceae bacterium]MCA3089340.1 Bax inhibitor-1/YccA family protein [Rhodocyclaceae bacterium]MCA3092901.1 Bax inhibitor-1/YccA family protein [Rhodocyclaceae bacterium]